MKQNVTRGAFIDAFHSIRPDNFTYAGLCALYDYLERLEGESGEEIKLDVIALCYDYTEYDSVSEFIKSYPDYGPENYETEQDTLGALESETTVIYISDDSTGESGFIILDF